MQLDTHFTLGNIVSVGAFVFLAGGAWYSLRQGLRDVKHQHFEGLEDVKRQHFEGLEEVKAQHTAGQAAINEKLEAISEDIKQVRVESVRKDVDSERYKANDLKFKLLEAELGRQAQRVESLEKIRRPR